jgi:hypothetical protein
MVGLFSSPKMPAPAAVPAAPSPNDANTQAAAQALQFQQANAAGRGSTILTSGQGDLSPPPLAKKTLLGA